MKRTAIKPMSSTRRRENVERRKMMEAKFGPRWSWYCMMPSGVGGKCHGIINGHELRKRSARGSIVDPENVITLCDFHNDWIENEPLKARELGLVIR